MARWSKIVTLPLLPPFEEPAMSNHPNSPESSPLLRFYLGEGPDTEGRFLREIRAWNFDRLERVHDYIQWLFPTRQRSQFNPDAPDLGEPEIRAFREDTRLRSALLDSLRQMLGFYGFAYREEGGKPVVETAANWPERSREWFAPGDHNLLRITRILDCLSTLGLPEQAGAFLRALEAVCVASPGSVPARTLEFWRGAVRWF